MGYPFGHEVAAVASARNAAQFIFSSSEPVYGSGAASGSAVESLVNAALTKD